MEEIFIKNQIEKSLLGLYSGEEIPNFTNHEIPERNIKFDKCTTQLLIDM